MPPTKGNPWETAPPESVPGEDEVTTLMAPGRSMIKNDSCLNNGKNNSNFILNIYSLCLYWYSDHLHLYIYISLYLYIYICI